MASIDAVANIALIPDYSFYGAAIAAGVSNVVGLAVGIVILKNITKRMTEKTIV